MNHLEKGKIIEVLVVCTGNLCRSPLAEALLKKAIQAKRMESNISVRSAGTMAVAGEKASASALNIASQANLDLSWHRSQPISIDLLQNADLILVMEIIHKRQICSFDSSLDRKIFLWAQYAGEEKIEKIQIPDPYGENLEIYQEIFKILNSQALKILERIITDFNL